MNRYWNHSSLDREALAWLVRLDDEPGNAALYAQLQLWIERSPAHRASWNDMLDLASEIGAALPLDAGSFEIETAPVDGNVTVLPRRSGLRERLSRNWRKAGALAVAACLGLAVAPDIVLKFRALEMTGTGEVKTVQLSDGSRAYLAPGSAIAFDIDQKGRAVHLLRGRAFFDVAHNPSRPFKVETDDAVVTVLGTAFEVDREDKGASVAVRRGVVEVAYAARGIRTLLHRGEMVALDGQGRAQRDLIRADRIAGWMNGKMFVKNRPIGDVLAELRPWYRGYIVARGSGLENRHVTGIYDLRDPDAALTALSKAHPLSVRQVTPWLKVVTVN